jgi:GNAT superfamily N-acetyltransferase
MPDMLVKLYELPPVQPVLEQQKAQGIDIRRALPPEKRAVVEWVADKFGNGWASECDVAFSNNPVSCFIAVKDGQLIGFACHDATCKDFFGPTGVDPACRGKGTGKALLLACLDAMAAQGYAYAIIGGAGPVDFYAKVAGATVIDGSVPGIYKGMLKL